MKHQIGDIVNYWRGVKDGEPSGKGAITDIGEISGTQVVWIKGCRGCVAVSHIEAAA